MDTPKRRCSKCKNEWPATTDFFHRDKSKKDGLRYACKRCESAHKRTYYQQSEARERIRAYQSRPEIRERTNSQRRIHYRHPGVREHQLEQNRIYRNRPGVRERINEHGRVHYHQPERHAHSLERMKVYNKRLDLREHRLTYHRNYWAQPDAHERKRLKKARRRAHLHAIPGTLTFEQVQYKLRKQHFRCYYCFTEFKKKGGKYIYHLEHTVPISRPDCNPRHDMSFIVLACPHCNDSKQNKLPHEWPEGGRLL